MSSVYRLPAEDEQVAMELRPHRKVLVRPVLVLLLLAPAASFLAARVPEGEARPVLRLGIAAVALLALARYALLPFLRWRATSYLVTDRRIITRSGVVARSGRDVPLARIADVTFSHGGLPGRVLGCGTLVVDSGGERGALVLRDVPAVEDVARELHRLADLDAARRPGRW